MVLCPGVDVTKLETAAAAAGKGGTSMGPVARSSTVLLVKNLPYSATEQELEVIISPPRLQTIHRHLSSAHLFWPKKNPYHFFLSTLSSMCNYCDWIHQSCEL